MSKNPKILIVDDEPRMCDSIKVLLSGQDYQVYTANSGQAAQEILSFHDFDLVLLDIVMPDMNGYRLMEYINTEHPDILVIVITGHASLNSAIEAIKRGAYDYLRKPFEYEELLNTVQNALDKIILKREKSNINMELEHSENRYRQLVQKSPDIIWAIDQGGNLTFINKAVERLLGYNSEHLIGKHYTDILLEKDLEKARMFLNKTESESLSEPTVELRFKVSDTNKTIKAFEVRCLSTESNLTDRAQNPGEKTNKTSFVIHGVARDISTRKHLESQLQEAQKLEALGTLAGGIAHNFNNLLMGIQGHISIIQFSMDTSDPHHERLSSIEDYIQSGSELTGQLLGLAKSEKEEVQPINLNELVSRISRMFGIARKEIVIHEKYEENIWPVEADHGQVEQVLLNLLVNAWQAMPGGGELILQTENIQLEVPDARVFNLGPGRYVKISVTDNGMGMDEDVQQRIFEPFFTTKEIGQGTGLGLASAYWIIKNHSGIIEVESKKGVGTTFNICLPASNGKVIRGVCSTSEIMEGPETVLLVDDETCILDVIPEILHSMGYSVLSAGSGREAIDIYSSKRSEIDIVLLDLIMPGMGGIETFDSLKKIDPKVKILLLSGYKEDLEVSEILRRGINGFIQKPFDPRGLSQKIREVLDGITT